MFHALSATLSRRFYQAVARSPDAAGFEARDAGWAAANCFAFVSTPNLEVSPIFERPNMFLRKLTGRRRLGRGDDRSQSDWA